MYEIIKNMAVEADQYKDYKFIDHIKALIDTLALTINAPSDWRDIGEKLATEYDSDSWIYEQLELWNHVED